MFLNREMVFRMPPDQSLDWMKFTSLSLQCMKNILRSHFVRFPQRHTDFPAVAFHVQEN